MGFKKKEWKDRVSEYPNRRVLTKADGSTEEVFVSRNEGLVAEEGDAFSADNMNGLEERVYAGFEEMKNSFVFDEETGTLTLTL